MREVVLGGGSWARQSMIRLPETDFMAEAALGMALEGRWTGAEVGVLSSSLELSTSISVSFL